MRNKRIAALAAVGAGAVLTVAGPVGAQEEPEPQPAMTVDPLSGPAGTVITVSGDLCLSESEELTFVSIRFVDFFGTSGVEEVTVLDETEAEPDAEGAWSTTIEAPDTPPGPYVIFAECVEDVEEPNPIGSYDPVEFEVTGGSTEPPAEEPPAEEPPAEEPPAATPVVDTPEFTG